MIWIRRWFTYSMNHLIRYSLSFAVVVFHLLVCFLSHNYERGCKSIHKGPQRHWNTNQCKNTWCKYLLYVPQQVQVEANMFSYYQGWYNNITMILSMNLICIMQERCSDNKNRASIMYCDNGLTHTALTPTTSLIPLSPFCSVMNQSGGGERWPQQI